MDKAARNRAFEVHETTQLNHWAEETSWEQRLNWLQSALEFVYASGVDYQAQRQTRIEQERLQRNK